jgi:hypothetical protein
MKLNELKLQLQDTKLDLFEMANVRPNKTGLDMVIYIGTRHPGVKHGPRIKVSKNYGDKVSPDFFSIRFDSSGLVEVVHTNTGNIKQKDVEKCVDFVRNNLDVLLKLWYDKIDVYDAISLFKKV